MDDIPLACRANPKKSAVIKNTEHQFRINLKPGPKVLVKNVHNTIIIITDAIVRSGDSGQVKIQIKNDHFTLFDVICGKKRYDLHINIATKDVVEFSVIGDIRVSLYGSLESSNAQANIILQHDLANETELYQEYQYQD